MDLKLSPKAFKEFKSLPNAQQQRFIKSFEKLEKDPYNLSKELHTKKLSDERFSLRSGNYRAIYTVKEDLIIVTVVRHRKESYR